MRSGIVVAVVVCGLAACEVRNGTYFVVEGDTAGIEFDKVEFFLGKGTTGDALYTPEHPYLSAAPLSAVLEDLRLKQRLFSESDIQDVSPGSTSLTLYLPPDPGNQFPHYALVVASRGGTAVGLGEIELFNVFDDGAYIYDIPLVPVPVDGSFERWGTDPDDLANACVRWTRVRGDVDRASTYAVVREHDRDCDGTATDDECDDYSYCAAEPINGTQNCPRREIGCIADSCELGTCLDGRMGTGTSKTTCIATTCLPDALCEGSCNEDGTAAEFFECAMRLPTTHPEVAVLDWEHGRGVCFHTYVVSPPAGMRCLVPKIEWPPLGRVEGWTFTVIESINPPGEACLFTMTGPTENADPPGETHLVVSVTAGSAPGRRTSFLVGFTPKPVGTAGCPSNNPPIPPLQGTANPTCL